MVAGPISWGFRELALRHYAVVGVKHFESDVMTQPKLHSYAANL